MSARPKPKARSTKKVALAQVNATSRKKSNRNRNRRGNPRGGSQRATLHMSPCALSFAKAKTDPFNYAENELPCIPDLLSIPSQKLCVLQKGVLSAGTAGFGFVTVAPRPNCNDQYNTWSSVSTFATVALPVNSSTTGTLGSSLLGFPWKIDDARSVRTVACALRVRYTGTELKRGGRLVLTHTNSEYNYIEAATFQELASRPEAKVFPCDRSWHSISWNPVYPAAYQYDTTPYPLSTSSTSNAGLFFAYEGEPGNTFEYEIIYYFEAISNGSNQVSGTTKSHTDITGMGIVKDFLASEVVAEASSSALNRFLQFAKAGAASYASSYFTGSPAGAVPLLQYL